MINVIVPDIRGTILSSSEGDVLSVQQIFCFPWILVISDTFGSIQSVSQYLLPSLALCGLVMCIIFTCIVLEKCFVSFSRSLVYYFIYLFVPVFLVCFSFSLTSFGHSPVATFSELLILFFFYLTIPGSYIYTVVHSKQCFSK